MARLFDKYRIERLDNLGDPAFWNRIFEDLDLRLHARELDGAKIDEAVQTLTNVALQRLNDTFTPVVEEALQRLADVGAAFAAESLTETAIESGTKNFVLTEGTRASFVLTDYLSVRPVGLSDRGMVCAVVSYDRATGLLVLTPVEGHIVGTGTYSSWTVRVTASPDVEHASRTDNPHSATAAQVGAYTTGEVDGLVASEVAARNTAITAAVDALKSGAPSAYDTLQEIAAYIATDESAGAAMLTALGLRLRVDTDAQGLTDLQKTNAHTNLGSGTAARRAITELAGAARVVGLTGVNNAAAPGTKMDFAAAFVVLRDPASGLTWVVSNYAATCDLDVNGANGRDQAGAFANSSWIRFFATWESGAAKVRASTAAPGTGPTVPAGTAWAYLGSVRKDSGGALHGVRIAGATVHFMTERNAVSSGSATSSTSVDVSALVPTEALSFTLFGQYFQLTADGGGSANAHQIIELVNGTTWRSYFGRVIGAGFTASAVVGGGTGTLEIPNVGQVYRYYVSIANGASPTVGHVIAGYKLPNGGE